MLYDANLPEIRSIVAAPDGSIYAAALGGSTVKRVGAATSAAAGAAASGLPTFSTSITVTDQQAGHHPVPKPEAAKPAASTSPATSAVTTSTTEYAGVDKSALYKIHPDNTVETLWSSKEENIYDLALDGSSVMLFTDAQGRIYRLDPSTASRAGGADE